MSIQLRTLGKVDLLGPEPERVRPVVAQAKRTALLTYLAVATPRGLHRRDTLLGLFWPEQDDEHARAALRQALHAIRRALGEGVVVTRGEDVAIDPAGFRCDVWDFEAACESDDVERVVTLYGGEFLAGLFISGAPEFERWVDGERRRLGQAYGTVLERAAEAAEERDPRRALEYWRRLAAHDPYSPRVALRLMACLDAMGDAPSAIRYGEQHVALLRDELGAAEDPEVEALLRRLREEPHSGLRQADVAKPAVPSLTARRKRRRPVTLLAPVLVLLAIASYWVMVGAHTPDRVSIAVLPFTATELDASSVFIAAGLTEAMRADLGTMSGLRVVEYHPQEIRALKYAERRRLAERLGVSHTLEGDVATFGPSKQIEVRVVDARTGTVLHTRKYRGNATEIFAIGQSVARDLVDVLGFQVSPDVYERLARPPTGNLRAYELYLRGKLALNDWNRRAVDSAITALNAAIEEDPSFALARATLANALLEKSDLWQPDAQYRSQAYVATETALLLDPALAEAHLAKGNVLWTAANRFPHEAAVREFQAAVRLRPSLSAAHDRLALIYLHVGLLDEALGEAREATRLDPLDMWPRFRIGHVLALQQRYHEAIEEFRHIPESTVPELRGTLLAEALLYVGEGQKAKQVIEVMSQRMPDDPLLLATRALWYAMQGDTLNALRESARAAQRAPGFAHGHHAEFIIGVTHAVLGRERDGIMWLTRAARNGFPCYPRFASDPLLDRLKQNPQYGALLRELSQQRDGYARAFAQPNRNRLVFRD